MSFGFSIGEFLAAATLIKDILVCLKNTGGAASEYQELMLELDGLQRALDKIEHLRASPRRADSINDLKVAALNCTFVLQDFRRKLGIYEGLDYGKQQKLVRNTGKKIRWELTMKEDTQNLRTYLSMHVGTLNARLAIEGLEYMQEIQKDFAGLKIVHLDEKKRKMLDWLSLIMMRDKQLDHFLRHQENTGQWLLGSRKFLEWMEGEDSNAILWCPGNPGVGKTVVSSIVIDHLQQKFKGSDISVVFFYCDYREKRTAFDVFSSLARQILEEHLSNFAALAKLYSSHGSGAHQLRISEIRALLLSICGENASIFIVIDAIDECPSSDDRIMILSTLTELSGPSARVLVTGRPNLGDVNDIMAAYPHISIIASIDDIRRYLLDRMRGNATFMKRITPVDTLEEEIVMRIVHRASGMFLMAVLQLDRIWAERTITRILKALDSLPSGLEATYQETLDRIRAQQEPDNTLGVRILQWISQSKRPLQIDELRHALAIEWVTGEDPPSDLDPNNLLSEEDLLDVCGGLVIVEPTSQIIRLAHFTIEEFFRNNLGALPNGNLEISRTCSVALQLNTAIRGLQQLADLKYTSPFEYWNEEKELRHKFPFLIYACCYWGEHIRELPVIESDLEILCLRFLNLEGVPVLVHHFVWENKGHTWEEFIFRGVHQWISSLRLLAMVGAFSLASKLLETGAWIKVNDQQPGYGTPLHWMVRDGHANFVRLLLTYGAEVDSLNTRGLTPLYVAVKHGHRGVMKQLLEYGANVNFADESKTALMRASFEDDVDTIQMLLDFDASVDLQDDCGDTALIIAAREGYEDCIKTLLKAGASIDLRDSDGYTALIQTASNGHKDCVRSLLEAGASMDLQGNDGHTALMFAAAVNGNEDCVRILLERGAAVDLQSNEGYSALMFAAQAGAEGCFKMLLEAGASKDLVDCNGQTALMWVQNEGRDLILQKPGPVEHARQHGRLCQHLVFSNLFFKL